MNRQIAATITHDNFEDADSVSFEHDLDISDLMISLRPGKLPDAEQQLVIMVRLAKTLSNLERIKVRNGLYREMGDLFGRSALGKARAIDEERRRYLGSAWKRECKMLACPHPEGSSRYYLWQILRIDDHELKVDQLRKIMRD